MPVDIIHYGLIYQQGRTLGHAARTATGADKIAGSDYEPPQAGPKGGGQDARSNPRRSPKAPTVGATENDQALLVEAFTAYPQKSVDGFILRPPGIGRCSLVKNIGL